MKKNKTERYLPQFWSLVDVYSYDKMIEFHKENLTHDSWARAPLGSPYPSGVHYGFGYSINRSNKGVSPGMIDETLVKHEYDFLHLQVLEPQLERHGLTLNMELLVNIAMYGDDKELYDRPADQKLLDHCVVGYPTLIFAIIEMRKYHGRLRKLYPNLDFFQLPSHCLFTKFICGLAYAKDGTIGMACAENYRGDWHTWFEPDLSTRFEVPSYHNGAWILTRQWAPEKICASFQEARNMIIND